MIITINLQQRNISPIKNMYFNDNVMYFKISFIFIKCGREEFFKNFSSFRKHYLFDFLPSFLHKTPICRNRVNFKPNLIQTSLLSNSHVYIHIESKVCLILTPKRELWVRENFLAIHCLTVFCFNPFCFCFYQTWSGFGDKRLKRWMSVLTGRFCSFHSILPFLMLKWCAESF